MKKIFILTILSSFLFSSDLNLSNISDDLLPPPLLAQKYKEQNKTIPKDINMPPMLPPIELVEELNDTEALKSFKDLIKELGYEK